MGMGGNSDDDVEGLARDAGSLAYGRGYVEEEAGDEVQDLDFVVADERGGLGGDVRVGQEAFERARVIGAFIGEPLRFETVDDAFVGNGRNRRNVFKTIAVAIGESHEWIVAAIRDCHRGAGSSKINAKSHASEGIAKRGDCGNESECWSELGWGKES